VERLVESLGPQRHRPRHVLRLDRRVIFARGVSYFPPRPPYRVSGLVVTEVADIPLDAPRTRSFLHSEVRLRFPDVESHRGAPDHRSCAEIGDRRRKS
jgi:hypothetical protein